MRLTERDIAAFKPLSHPYKKSIDGLLYLHVAVSGRKTWRYRLRQNGMETSRLIGEHPAVSLIEAKRLAREMDVNARHGSMPAPLKLTGRKRSKVGSLCAHDSGGVLTVQTACLNWLTEHRLDWGARHRIKVENALSAHVYPKIGDRPLESIKAGELRSLILQIQSSGRVSLGVDMRQWLDRVFALAILNESCARNPAAEIKGMLRRGREVNRAAVPLHEAGTVLAAIEQTNCPVAYKRFSLALALSGLRTSELAELRWEWFDNQDLAQANCFVIPAARMKGRLDHLVPITEPLRQLFMDQLNDLNQSGLVFSVWDRSGRKWKRLHSNVALNVIDAAGFGGRQTGHGFRSWLSTFGHEREFLSDAVEYQLAHIVGSSVRRAYNRAKYLGLRERLMRDYTEWLMQERELVLAGAKAKVANHLKKRAA